MSIYNHIYSFGIKIIKIEIRELKFKKNSDVASKLIIFRKDIVYDWVFISSRYPSLILNKSRNRLVSFHFIS